MRMGRNVILGLLGSTAPAGVSTWSSGTGYSRGTTVLHQGRLYKARINIAAGSSSSTEDPKTAWFWSDQGPAYSNWTDGTNAKTSFYPAWSSSTTYEVGDIVYDYYSLSDFICMVANGPAPERPTTAPIDTTTQRLRWTRLGPANAFKMVDGQTISRTVQSGSTLTANVSLSAPATLVGVFGIKGCSSVTARAYRADNVTTSGDLRTFDLAYTGESGYKSKIIFTPTATEIANGFIWRFTFTKETAAPSVEVGMISACVATDFGMCQVQPRVSGMSFSNTKYDETFGGVNFVKRGFANEISCEIITEQDRQDFLVTTLNRFQGEPVLIDLNNDTQYEHLATWGFYEAYSADYYGWSNADTKITLTVKTLVEE